MKNLHPAFVPYIMILSIALFYIYLERSKRSIFHPISIIFLLLVIAIIIISIIASDTFNIDNMGMWIQYMLMIIGVAIILWKNKHDE